MISSMKQEYYLASREQIIRLLETMLKSHRVFAPISRRHNFSFEEIKSKQYLSKIEFEYDTTILPPKKIFYPSDEVMFTQKNGNPRTQKAEQSSYDGKIREPQVGKPALIFGVHPVDLYGILQMDEIMANPKPDYYYLRNRKSAILIGINQAKENQYDFSERWGILKNNIPEAFDIFLEKIDNTDDYLLLANSSVGKKIVQKAKFKKADKKMVAAALARRVATPPPQKAPYDQDTIKKAVLSSRGGKIWEELEKICLGCGICTYVCPLCYCFDVEDKTNYSTNECSRCRKWDACTLPTFSEIAGGKNFRPELKQRYFNWYFHKFVRALEEQGQAQCVGCGRCSKFCPAGINVENVLDKIMEQYGQN